MKKDEVLKIVEATEKYQYALSSLLYPCQYEELQEALIEYFETNEIKYIENPFVRLAYMMIISDLIWEEGKEGELIDS